MNRRFEWRLYEMMARAEVSPELLKDLLSRVRLFFEPFLQNLPGPSKKRALEYMAGLMSGLKHKTGEGIAYLYDQDRQGIQKFVGQTAWDHQPPLLSVQTPHFDDSPFPFNGPTDG